MSIDFQEELKEIDVEWQPRFSYIPEQNGKAERQNYILMALVRLIMAAKNHLQFLWSEILKSSAYLKNQSLEPDLKTSYKQFNYEKPNFSHFKVLGARTWVYILEKVQKRQLTN